MASLPKTLDICGIEYVRRDSIEERAHEELFTVDQVAEMSHTSKTTVYDCIKRGALIGRAPNGCEKPILIKRSDYESWVGLR
jgi:hypothetical protein